MKPEGSVDELDEIRLFRELSNWDRFGPDDELGTLNFIGGPQRVAAARSILDGRAISCGRPLPDTSTIENSKPFLRHVVRSGMDAPSTGMGYAEEWLGLYVHGYASTHLDAPAHAFWDGQMYGGRPANTVQPGSGAAVGSVASAASAAVGRGVLFDLPSVRDTSWLEPGDAITIADMVACEERHRVEVGTGDILFVRTGREARHLELGPIDPQADGNPGLATEVLAWLAERQVALLGTDVVAEVRPRPSGTIVSPVHTIALVAMGLWLVDNLALEQLAIACSEADRWSFFAIVAPLVLTGGTGSPVNPIAVL